MNLHTVDFINRGTEPGALATFTLSKCLVLVLLLTTHRNILRPVCADPRTSEMSFQGPKGATLADAVITCARLSVIQKDLPTLDDPCVQSILSGQAQQTVIRQIPTPTNGPPVPTATPALSKAPKPTKTPPTTPPVPPTTSIVTSTMTPAPLSSKTACFTADNTTGAPFAPAKCPPGSCVSSLQTQTGSYHNPLYDQDALIPIFYSITIICTDVSSGLATSQLVEGFGSNGTNGVFINPGYEVLEAPSGCLTGIGANVAFPSSQSGSAVFFVSTLYLLSNTSNFVGYYPGQSPFTNYSLSSLGTLICDPGTYITEIYGRSGLIMDDPCFTCSALGH